MSIMPANAAENTWDIKLCVKVDGELRCISERFVGTIREAMSHEMQLRGRAKDGNIDLERFGD